MLLEENEGNADIKVKAHKPPAQREAKTLLPNAMLIRMEQIPILFAAHINKIVHSTW